MLQGQVQESAGYLRETLPELPQLGMVLGSGLGTIADEITDPIYIPYASIPYMKASTAQGHAGRFVCGMLEGVHVICMQGRLHLYEGYSAAEVAFPIRIMSELGVRRLILTNASGGVNMTYEVGDLVLISDHINLTGRNPLVGVYDATGSVVVPDMTYAYPEKLRSVARDAARRKGITLREGVYAGVLGPSFETPAEIRALRTLGIDVVGMSTVTETIAAVAAGMEVLGISLVTNMAAGVLDEPITVEEVSRIGERSSLTFCSLIRGIVAGL